MTSKFKLAIIFLQALIFAISLFDIVTQSGNQRQPTKLFMQTICICSLISVSISTYHYLKDDQE